CRERRLVGADGQEDDHRGLYGHDGGAVGARRPAGRGPVTEDSRRHLRARDAAGCAGRGRQARRSSGAGRKNRWRPRHPHHRRRRGAFGAMAPVESQPIALQTAGCCRMTSPLEQKKIRITGPSVVTANRTWDGAVVYRTARQGWSTALSDAAIVSTSDDARALLAESVADDGAVGAYIAPVELREGGMVKPGNLREHIRSKGLTIDLLPA